MRLKWSRLDNAAKIYPASSTKTDTHVFRFACELNEPVNPEILQSALIDTTAIFPVYQYILKRGLFWYYLESTTLTPIVRQEYKPPCNELYDRNQKTLLYEVTYFGNIINLEVYHVLTDGTGAMNFLRILVSKYLSVVHSLPEPEIDYDASHMQMADDSFKRYYNNKPLKRHRLIKEHTKAYRIKGPRFAENRIKIIRGMVSVSEILKIARGYNSTLTAFLAACLIQAINEEITVMSKKYPVVLAIPVNLRNYFKSESARNFFSIVYTGFDSCVDNIPFDEIVKKVNNDLKHELTVEKMSDNLNLLYSLERNFFVRIAPLFLKDIVLKFAYSRASAQSTATLSNVGIIKLSDSIAPYIKSFDVCTGTNRLQVCICSYLDNLSVNFTTPFISSDIQRRFFRKLTDLGLEVEITANQIADE
ncbi:MAG: hypothetical protein PHZ09_07495 [Eubacteriales bacterium]|nr:hypothetical protein [Eubacteriales bacterium]